MIVALRITQHEADPSMFVVFITYLAQVCFVFNIGHRFADMSLVVRAPEPAWLHLSLDESVAGRHRKTAQTSQ